MKKKEDDTRSKSPAFSRRGFLKGASAGAATLAAGPSVNAASASPAISTVSLPTEAMVNAEAGPSAASDPHFVDNPASDFMVDVIKSLGMPYMTTNPGSSFQSFHESLINYGANTKPELLTCLHEESAVGMAHGYAKIEGKPIGCLLHGTVGLLHASMAIYNAYADRVPVFILVGNHYNPAARVAQFHSAQDMGGLVRDYVKWDSNTIEPQHFANSAMRAYKIAMTPPMGPTLVMIDEYAQGQSMTDRSALHVPKLVMPAPPQGDRNAVRELARMLIAADRPKIITGRSARTPAGIDWLVQLAELIQAPVSGELKVNFPWTHPLFGSGGEDYKADFILGLEVNDMASITVPAMKSGAKTASISSIDLFHNTNILDYGRYAELDLSLAADAEATLPSLIEEVQALLTRNRRKAIRERGESIADKHARERKQQRENARYGWTSRPISTARLCAELWHQIKKHDWSLVSWQGFISRWPGILWEIEKHYHYLGFPGAGGMGYGAQAAVGAALANREHGRLSVNIQCDGDLNYAPGVLWTAAHHEIPLLTVMHNNRAYHAEVMFVQKNATKHRRGEDRAHIGTTIRDPDIDYAKMAQCYGQYGEGPIENPDDLGPAIKRALERVLAGEPALLDVVTQPR